MQTRRGSTECTKQQEGTSQPACADSHLRNSTYSPAATWSHSNSWESKQWYSNGRLWKVAVSNFGVYQIRGSNCNSFLAKLLRKTNCMHKRYTQYHITAFAVSQDHIITAAQYNITSHHITVSQHHNISVSQYLRITSHHSTTISHYSITSQYLRITTSHHSITVSQHHSIAISHYSIRTHHNIKISHHSITISHYSITPQYHITSQYHNITLQYHIII